MLYSVKMRAAQGAAHENGGKHISGAERLVLATEIEQTVTAMLKRAHSHERGSADFINIKISKIASETIATIPALQIMPLSQPPSLQYARQYAAVLLVQAGISSQAISVAFEQLVNLQQSLRGALLVEASSGKVIADSHLRHGVRVSNMDAQDNDKYTQWLSKQNIHGVHAREAIVLASKVASCPDIVAELCWSDDPSYTIGYVNDKAKYHRIDKLKEAGSDIGGRVFFLKDNYVLANVVEYLHNQPVLLEV